MGFGGGVWGVGWGGGGGWGEGGGGGGGGGGGVFFLLSIMGGCRWNPHRQLIMKSRRFRFSVLGEQTKENNNSTIT